MRKAWLVVLLAVLLCVSGCRAVVKAETEMQIAMTESEVLSENAQPMSVETEIAEPPTWATAYADVFAEKSEGTLVNLLDIDFDGVPELLFLQRGMSNDWICSGISYKDVEICDIVIAGESRPMPVWLELWREKVKREPQWVASGMFKCGPSSYDHLWYEVDFDDFTKVETQCVFGFNEGADESGMVYSVYTDFAQRESVDAPYEEIGLLQAEFMAQYEVIEVQKLSAHVSEFYNEGIDKGDDWLNAEYFDREALMAFFAQWHSE